MSEKMNPKKVAVVAGATGLVGQQLVKLLSERDDYVKVIALTRRPRSASSHIKIEERAIPSGDEIIQGDEFYCALGTTIKIAGSKDAFWAVDHDLVIDLVKRAKNGQVKRIVVVSAIGANEKSANFYTHVKGVTERDLRALKIENLEIYQPSLLIGDRQEFRLGEKIAEFFVPLVNPFLKGPLKKYRPIHATDLARKMICGTSL